IAIPLDNRVEVFDLKNSTSVTLKAARATRTVDKRERSDSDGVVFSPDGDLIAGVLNHRVQVWKARGPQLWTVDTGSLLNGVRFSPDGRRLVSYGSTARLWDMQGHR